MKELIIATRKSKLAQVQTERVMELIKEKENIKDEIDISSDYEKFEEELFNSYRTLPIAFINKNIAISNKVSNVFLDGNGNLDLSNIKK